MKVRRDIWWEKEEDEGAPEVDSSGTAAGENGDAEKDGVSSLEESVRELNTKLQDEYRNLHEKNHFLTLNFLNKSNYL